MEAPSNANFINFVVFLLFFYEIKPEVFDSEVSTASVLIGQLGMKKKQHKRIYWSGCFAGVRARSDWPNVWKKVIKPQEGNSSGLQGP